MSRQVMQGDCLEVMAGMEADSVDAIVCDPPYALTNRTPDVMRCEDCGRVLGGSDGKPDVCPKCGGTLSRQRSVQGAGFMGKAWDSALPGVEIWAEALRVAKPGAHLLAFGGTRTFHRLACAIEDAGWEIRDCLSWLYGSGFPKSLDVGKALDKAAGAEREVVGPNNFAHLNGKANATCYGAASRPPESTPATDLAKQWDGWGTALKPGWEPIILARKPLVGTVASNVAEHGTGGLNIDGTRIGTADDRSRPPGKSRGVFSDSTLDRRMEPSETNPAGRWPANVVLSHTPDCREVGTRKVKGSGSIAGTEPSKPARGVHRSGFDRVQFEAYADADGLETVSAWECAPDCPVAMLDEQSGSLTSGANPTRRGSDKFRTAYGDFEGQRECEANRGIDVGGASRFFLTVRPDQCENASTAGESSSQSSQPDGSAPSGAVTSEALEGAPNRPASRATRDSTGNSVGSTPIPSHVPSADSQGSTDTTPTIPNRCESCGSALRVTDAPTSQVGEEAVEVVNVQVSGTRFRYCAKSSRAEREAGLDGMPAQRNDFQRPSSGLSQGKNPATGERSGVTMEPRTNHHPTVKPLGLMRWLCRLVTPPGGLILDPFAGSGSTGCAAVLESFRFIGIEREAEYCEIARKAHCGLRRATLALGCRVSAPARIPVQLSRLERETVRMNIKTLEVRAKADSRVVISAKMALSVAKHLRLLLEGKS